MSSRRYCLVTPCRDEARYARRTLDAIVAQAEPPALWVIVDDGSTDETPVILAEYAERYPWIRVVRRADRGHRKVGGGVVDAFYAGYETISPAAFDYVCKLDLDLDLPRGYFASLMDRMEANPRIGTCSGKAYHLPASRADEAVELPLLDATHLVSEKLGDENSAGMIKFYRTRCFQQIGGFVREVMWDGIDGHRCRQLGWIAVSWDDPELRFVHLRPMGSSHRGVWTGRKRHGYGKWFMGTSLPYMIASALYRTTRPPLLVGGAGMLWGYLRAMAARAPRYGDAEFRRFLRGYELASLLRGKRRATADLEARQEHLWNPAAPGPQEEPPPRGEREKARGAG